MKILSEIGSLVVGAPTDAQDRVLRFLGVQDRVLRFLRLLGVQDRILGFLRLLGVEFLFILAFFSAPQVLAQGRPPVFIQQPTNQIVLAGSNVTFAVTMGPSVTPLLFQWLNNGAAIAGATNASLTLTNLLLSAGGNYSVNVANAAAPAGLSSDPAGLTVVQDSSISASLGANATLQVASYGPPLLSYQWRFNGQDIPGATTNPYVITGAQPANVGQYSVVVSSPAGKITLFVSPSVIDPTFTKITTGDVVSDSNALNAVWGDLDNDGYLDLVALIPNLPPVFYHNNRDGTFTKMASGSLPGLGSVGSVSAALGDYNNDGCLDLLIGQEAAPSASGRLVLLKNNGDGTFANSGQASSSMLGLVSDPGGVGWVDYNNVGWLDAFVGSRWFDTDSVLFQNRGDDSFSPVAIAGFAGALRQVYGAAWADYDNDGFLDLLVINAPLAGLTTNAVYHNNGDGTFTAVSLGSLTSDLGGYAAAGWADYDNDGFLDLFVANSREKNMLYRNNGNSNRWVKVQCVGTASNRAGIGAKVRVQATYRGASRRQMREIFGGDGVVNAQPLVAHFGLGDATNSDLVRIEWPLGIVQELKNVAPKQYLTVTEPKLTVTPKSVDFVGGTNVTFTASVTNIASPQFQWLFNGNPLVGETKGSLRVTNLIALSAGKYTVVVRTTNTVANTAETDSASGVIQPAILPTIAQQPQSLTVNPGSTASFQATATGSAPLAYQWLHNGAALAGATNASWQISQAGPADAGEYILVIDNPAGETRSAPVLLSLVGAPKIVVEPRDQSVSMGATVTFGVVPDGTPSFAYQWRANGQALLGANGQTLTLLNVRGTDGGQTFSVVVSNALGQVTSREALLTVDTTFTKVTTGGLANDVGHYHGQAWGDYNNDGYMDLLMVGLDPEHDALFRNNGDGTFTKIHPSPWQRPASPYVWAYGWGDYDNDGFLDLYLGDTSPDGAQSPAGVLLENNGAGGFTSLGAIAAIGNFSGAWADYDMDGRLDLATAQGPASVSQQVAICRNKGDRTFLFTQLSSGPGPGYVAPAWVDLNSDGWLDLFLTHYGANNAVYLNLGQGQFQQLTNSILINYSGKWMASAWGDYNNNGGLDVFVTAAEGQNALYRNDGHGVFTKMTTNDVGSLAADVGSSWGCAWGDYDNDGWLDLFVANANGQGNFLYHNNGDGTFTRITSGSIANDQAQSITCNWVDYDKDGFLDLFVQNHSYPEALTVTTPNFLYHNAGNSNHWLAFKCVGTKSPRDGTGTTVRLLATPNPNRNPNPT